MLINLRNALMAGKRLPYDAEVEYLESSGTQYINTGVVPTTTKTEITFSTPTPPSSGYMCGSFNANNNRYYPAAFSGSSTRYINLINAANTVISQYTNDGNVHTVVYNATGGACYFDGAAAGTLDTTTLTASNPIYLFCTSTSTGASGLVSGRIYSCKLYDADGTLVRDLIPVRKGTVGYLYDRVSGKLFGNAGTGDFTCGPDVVPVEYIESHAAEYIDTGAIPDDSTGIEVVHTICTDNEKDNIIFGARQDSGNTRYWSDIDWGANDSIGWGFNTYSGNNERFILTASDAGRIITNSLNFMNDRAGKIDGVTYDSSLQSKTLATINRSIYLFGANNMGTIAIRGTFKVYSAKISKGQTLVNKFLPVRVGSGSTWEGAMMDTLTRRIYRNMGTGAFSYGNDLKYPIPAE